jgi:peptide/nickel transport system substrate-binding protein
MRSVGLRRSTVAVAAAVITVAGLAACSSSAAPGTTTTPSGSSGQPHAGGTLYMLGTGDVDFMDPNVTFYTVGDENLRMWVRPLMSYPAVAGQTETLEPDLAEAAPVVSDHGLEYSFTIRSGVDWDTTPARQVTAADIVRGLERACNPVKPNSGVSEYESLIVGLTQFCAAFEATQPTIPAINAFLKTHSIPGAYADPANPLTIIFKLTHPAVYFPAVTAAYSAFYGAPAEYMSYLPASVALSQHTISDGPYQVQSYVPGKSIVYVRNPVWKAALDPISKAYVNKIVVNETVTPQTVQEELQANSPTADLYWGDTQVPAPDIPALTAAHSPGLVLGPTDGLNPFLIFNMVDPNDGGAIKDDVSVRQAISYAIDRTALIQDSGGPQLAPALTQLLPGGANSSTPITSYTYDPAKAKQLLGGKKLTIKLLYQADTPIMVKIFQTIQYDLSQVGITVTGVGVPTADIYTKYLEVPNEAKTGVWDIAESQLFPTWYGPSFAPTWLFAILATAAEAPNGPNLGLYSNPAIDKLLNQALSATSESSLEQLSAQADELAMQQAVTYPIDSPSFATYYSSQVHNAVFVPCIQGIDPTNVWLSQ